MSRQRNIKITTGRDLPTALLPSLLLGLNLLVFGTWAVYSHNPREFLVTYSSVFWKFFAPALILFVGVGLLSRSLGRRSRLIFNTIIIFLAFASYMHGNLLTWDMGVLDGQPLTFSESWRSGADGLAWLMLAYLVIRFRRWLYVHGWQICLLLIAFQSIAALSSLLDFEAPERATTSLPEQLASFSPERNVIHIVLDGFQGNTFENLLKSHPDLNNTLEGFTFFRDSSTSSDVTYLSIPAVLTGQVFTNQTSISDYLESTFEGENLYRLLADNQFAVDIATPLMWNKPEPWFSSYMLIPTPYAGKREIETSSAYLLLDISLFRQVPHFLKPAVYHAGSWMLSGTLVSNPKQQFQTFSHLAFLRDLQARMTVESGQPRYKFLHLVTPHAPLVSLPDCRFSGTPLEDKASAYPDQAYCVMQAVTEFLDELKSRGIYDQSLILIHGDHGGGVPFAMNDENGDPTTSFDALYHVWGNPLPLLMIKPVQAKGTLNISNQQVQLPDIAATVADLLGLQNEFPGRSMFDPQPPTRQPRMFYHSTMHRTEAANKDHFDDFTGYQISGSIFDVSSWKQVYSYTAPVTNELQKYSWGNKISFGSEGNYNHFQTGGWGLKSDPGPTWSVAKQASMAIDFGTVKSTVKLRATVKPYLVAGQLEQQHVNIYVGATKAGEWLLSNQKFAEVSLELEPQLFNTGSNTDITFEFPDAASPIAMGTGKDIRELGVAFMLLRFDLLNDGAGMAKP